MNRIMEERRSLDMIEACGRGWATPVFLHFSGLVAYFQRKQAKRGPAKAGGPASQDQMRLMLQTLLADRVSEANEA